MKMSIPSAAREITSSCFLIDANGAGFLVDCGLVQSGRRVSVRQAFMGHGAAEAATEFADRLWVFKAWKVAIARLGGRINRVRRSQ